MRSVKPGKGGIVRLGLRACAWAVAAAVVPVATFGCGDAAEGQEAQPLTTSIGVIRGTASPETHDSVVFLRAEQDGVWINCSGTLVSPRIVVTAKHCVAAIQDRSFVCRGDGDLVPDGTGAGTFGDTFPASSLTVHLGATPAEEAAATGSEVLVTDASSACRDDLAVVILDNPVDVPSYAPIRWTARTRVGEKVTLIGYGMGEMKEKIVRREVRDVRILDVGTLGSTGLKEPTTPPRSLAVGGDTVCSGDSGGPALSATTGALVGTYSRITGDCFSPESRNTYMLIAGFKDLLTRAFAKTGEPLVREPEIPSAGDAAAPAEPGAIADLLVEGSVADAGAPSSAVEPASDTPAAPTTVTSTGPFKCSASHGEPIPANSSGLGLALVAMAGLLGIRRRSARAAYAVVRSRIARGG